MTGVEFSEVMVNRGAVGDQELCHEDELANHSPRTACKLGTYPEVLGSIFGKPKSQQQRTGRQLPSPPTTTHTPDQLDYDLDLPDPPTSTYSPREAELTASVKPKRSLPEPPPSAPALPVEEPMVISNEVAVETLDMKKRVKEVRIVEKDLGDMKLENFSA
eukprot:sb/3472833/